MATKTVTIEVPVDKIRRVKACIKKVVEGASRPKRKPSAYNKFMSKTLKAMKKKHPEKLQKEIFSLAVAEWRKTGGAKTKPKAKGKAKAKGRPKKTIKEKREACKAQGKTLNVKTGRCAKAKPKGRPKKK